MPRGKRRRVHRGSGIGRLVQQLREQSPGTTTSPVTSGPSSTKAACSKAQEKSIVVPRITATSRNCGGIFKGGKFCGDGTSIVTCSEDNALRVFQWPRAEVAAEKCLSPDVILKHGSCIYDYCWYPFYDGTNWATCCLLSTSKDHPVQLWDRFTGKLRATYFPRNDDTDELQPALSVAFNATGDRIFAGASRALYVFDVASPGSQIERRKTKLQRRRGTGQSGLISCVASNPDRSGLIAAGSYAKTVCLYVENDESAMLAELHGHTGGVTQVTFAPDGRYLYSGARADNRILCWDIRNTCEVLMEIPRTVETNQRVSFDLNRAGDCLITGNTHSRAVIYGVNGSNAEKRYEIDSGLDAVNGVSFNPAAANPETCCITTGRRHFDEDPARRRELEDRAELQVWDINTASKCLDD